MAALDTLTTVQSIIVMVFSHFTTHFTTHLQEMAALDTLTTDQSIEEFKALYLKCVVRELQA
jgi:hypothetical protein